MVRWHHVETIGLLVLLVVIATFAWGAYRGAPWVPTRRRDSARILALARPHPGMRVADVGCGSAGVLGAFARAGCVVRGWELAILPWLVARFRFRGSPRAVITYGDFWYEDLGRQDLVYAFLMPSALARLTKKLSDELAVGARVITYAFPLPGWSPITVDHVDGRPTLYLYERVRDRV